MHVAGFIYSYILVKYIYTLTITFILSTGVQLKSTVSRGLISHAMMTYFIHLSLYGFRILKWTRFPLKVEVRFWIGLSFKPGKKNNLTWAGCPYLETVPSLNAWWEIFLKKCIKYEITQVFSVYARPFKCCFLFGKIMK